MYFVFSFEEKERRAMGDLMQACCLSLGRWS